MAKPYHDISECVEVWVFVLYKNDKAITSKQAESTLIKLCEKYLHGCYALEVIDINHNIDAVPQDIFAVPTVIRKLPLPERRVIGNLSELEKTVAALGFDQAHL